MSTDNYFLSGVNIQDSCKKLSAGECFKQSILKRGIVTSHMVNTIKAKQEQNNSNILVDKVGVLEVDLNTGKLISNTNRLIEYLNGFYVPVNTNNIIQINQHIMNTLSDINFVSRVGFSNLDQAKMYATLLMKDNGGMNDAIINVRERREKRNMLLINKSLQQTDVNIPNKDTLPYLLNKQGVYMLDNKDIHFNTKQRFITIKNNDIITKYTNTKTPSKLYFVVFNMNKNIKVNSMGVKEGFTGSNNSVNEGANAPKTDTGYDNGPGWANDEGWLCLDKDSGTAGVPMRIDEYGLVQGMTGSGDKNGSYKFGACAQSTIPTDRSKIGLICGDPTWTNNTDKSNKGWTDERKARTVKNVFGYGQDWAEKEGSMCDVAANKLPLIELNTPQPAMVPPVDPKPTTQPTPQAAALALPTKNTKLPSHLDTTKDKEMVKHLLTSIDDDVNATQKVNKQHVKFLKLQKDQLKLMKNAVAKKKHQLKELREDSYTNQTLTRFEEYKMKRTLAQRKIITMLITGVTVCMILVILQKYTPLNYIVPDIIFSSLFSIVTVITIYYLGKSIIDFSQRSTKNFDEYDWHGLKDPIVESSGDLGIGFDITAFDNIDNQDEITLKFSGKDANMINTKVNKLKNSKNIISDLNMLGNNVHVGIATNDIGVVEEKISDIKNSFGDDLGKIKI
jgi:hypothetical protein